MPRSGGDTRKDDKMRVKGNAQFLKADSGTTERDGKTRTWHRASFLDENMETVTLYLDDPSMLSGVPVMADCELTIDMNQGRRGWFTNLYSIEVL